MDSQKWIKGAELAEYKAIERDKAERQNNLDSMRAKWKGIYRACNYATISIILFLFYAGTKGN